MSRGLSIPRYICFWPYIYGKSHILTITATFCEELYFENSAQDRFIAIMVLPLFKNWVVQFIPDDRGALILF